MSDEDYDPDELYCLCQRPYSPSQFMIECDVCKDWFHGSCVGIEEHQGGDIDVYHCPKCAPKHGPLVLKRRRNWHRHDYTEKNSNKKATESGTVEFIAKLKEREFSSSDEVLLRLRGSDLTTDYFDEHGFEQPILVETKDDLGLRVPPPSFKISDIERCVGSMRELDVIDVAQQEDIRMKMREWTEYYEVIRPRKKRLNVISLEFSDTELSRYVSAPKTVREMDWINNYWPEELPPGCIYQRPQVQKYCLMGVKDSYTDFHVDFGGTSVWYHVVRGEKMFYFIKPTAKNFRKYEQWVSSSSQSEIFFGDVVDNCYVCSVRPGNTLFIPSGWIHAVLTPEDSLVFGGNFVHRYCIRTQLQVYELELRLDTPEKFLHPSYESLTWYSAQGLLDELHGYTRELSPPVYLLNGLAYMVVILRSWIKTRKDTIPETIDPVILLQQLTKALSVAIMRFQSADQLQFSVSGSTVVLTGRRSPAAATNSTSTTGRKRSSMRSGHIPARYQLGGEYGTMSSDDTSEDNKDVLRKGGAAQRRRSTRESTSDGDYRDSNEDEEDDAHIIKPYDDDEREGWSARKKRRSHTSDDDLWMPGGNVKLLPGSVTNNSRLARPHARKLSTSKYGSKVARSRLESDEKLESKYTVAPAISGGALLGPANASTVGVSSQLVMNRNRATAAATAVNMALGSSRMKQKPRTSKQRIGKIIGLDKGGVSSGWK